jgi:hypothetical protein
LLPNLIRRVLEGKDRTLKDTRSQIQVSRVNRQLIVYRYGAVQFWYDLDTGLRQFCMVTNAEVRAYNKVLLLVQSPDIFIKNGPTVYYKQGDKLWKSSEWNCKP